MQEYENRVIVITGGGSGIGQAIALEACRLGMRIVVNDQDKDYLNETEKLLKETGADFKIFEADMSLAENAKALLDFALEAYGQVDILVNSAGVSVSGPLWEIPEQDIKWITETNFLGHLYTARVFIQQMIKQETPAAIVNVASTAGLMTSGNAIMYHATKFGDVGLAETHPYLSLKHRNINHISVHCVAPAFIKTNIHEGERCSRTLSRFE